MTTYTVYATIAGPDLDAQVIESRDVTSWRELRRFAEFCERCNERAPRKHPDLYYWLERAASVSYVCTFRVWDTFGRASTARVQVLARSRHDAIERAHGALDCARELTHVKQGD